MLPGLIGLLLFLVLCVFALVGVFLAAFAVMVGVRLLIHAVWTETGWAAKLAPRPAPDSRPSSDGP